MRSRDKAARILPGQGKCSAPRRIVYWRMLLIIAVFVCFGLFLIIPKSIHAQSDDAVLVQPPDIGGFPTPSVRFKIRWPASSQPVEMLQASAITVYENEQTVPVRSLEQDYVGIFFALVINGGRELDLRDVSGISSFGKLQAELANWAEKRVFSDGDALAFVTHEGVILKHANRPDMWVDAVEAYQPNFRIMTPDLAGLESALKLVAERVEPFGVDKMLLYITPPPLPEQLETIRLLTDQAQSAGIHINVWMLGEPFFLNNEQGRVLSEMASRTGGQFFHITGGESIPDPEQYLKQLGFLYHLAYDSGLQETGTYPLEIHVELPNETLRGESLPFYIDIHPPNPMLIAPPAVISRQANTGAGDTDETLSPETYPIEIMVSFPDGYPREIVGSRLIVDGRVVAVRVSAPFDSFTWDLTGLTESVEHNIMVEVDDSLGLSGRTILTPVQIDILATESLPSLTWPQVGLIVAGVIVLGSLTVLVGWFVRRREFSEWLPKIWLEFFKAKTDQGITVTPLPPREVRIYATLLPLIPLGEDPRAEEIHITQRQTCFGSDPELAEQVIDMPEIEGLHAQTIIQGGVCQIQDLGSETGTWVNYDSVGTKPIRIYPGDLIHFGNLGFRFTIIDKENSNSVTISNYESII